MLNNDFRISYMHLDTRKKSGNNIYIQAELKNLILKHNNYIICKANTMTTYEKMINEQDNETLILNVLEYIAQHHGNNMTNMPVVERNIVAVITAQAVIDNGGFRYFFEMDFEGRPHYHVFVEAYDEIGATESAGSIEQMLAHFPDKTPPLDHQERREYLDDVFKSADVNPELAIIESMILGKVENYSLVAKYIRANSAAIKQEKT
jgi:hypothetical protein